MLVLLELSSFLGEFKKSNGKFQRMESLFLNLSLEYITSIMSFNIYRLHYKI